MSDDSSFEDDLKNNDKRQTEKDKGDALIRKNAYSAATEHYLKELRTLNFVYSKKDEIGPEKLKEFDDIKRATHSNLALCYMKDNLFSKAVDQCCEVLLIDPSNAKARMRRATCNMERDEFQLALDDCNALIQMQTDVDFAQKMIGKIVAKKNKTTQRAKTVSKKMLSDIAKPTPTPPTLTQKSISYVKNIIPTQTLTQYWQKVLTRGLQLVGYRGFALALTFLVASIFYALVKCIKAIF